MQSRPTSEAALTTGAAASVALAPNSMTARFRELRIEAEEINLACDRSFECQICNVASNDAAISIDYFVCETEQSVGDCEAERSGGGAIDHKFGFCGP